MWKKQGQQRPTATKPQAPPGYEIKPDGSLVKTGGGAVVKESVAVKVKSGVLRTVGRGALRVLGGAASVFLGEMIDPDPVGGGDADIGPGQDEFAWRVRDTFLDQRYSLERLQEDTIFYRIYSDPDRMKGVFLTQQCFTSSSEAISMLALSPNITPNKATHIVAVVLPADTIIARGLVAPQDPSSKYPGGGSQVVIPNREDPRIHWVNPHRLEP